jgi:hypothetical protein
MDNVTIAVEGNKLTLTIDLSEPGTVSASGKTTVIASTRGNTQIAPSRRASIAASTSTSTRSGPSDSDATEVGEQQTHEPHAGRPSRAPVL